MVPTVFPPRWRKTGANRVGVGFDVWGVVRAEMPLTVTVPSVYSSHWAGSHWMLFTIMVPVVLSPVLRSGAEL